MSDRPPKLRGKTLLSFSIKDFRCFTDSGDISMGDIMVLLGANSAGKSSVMTVLRMLKSICAASGEPDLIRDLPELASFDSVVRKQWSKKQGRPQSFQIGAEWVLAKNVGESLLGDPVTLNDTKGGFHVRTTHTFCRHPIHGGAQLQTVRYISNFTGVEDVLVERLEAPVTPEPHVKAIVGKTEINLPGPTFTHELTLPSGLSCFGKISGLSVELGARGHSQKALKNSGFASLGVFLNLVRMIGLFEGQSPQRIIAPERPKPRSYYVLDDPSFTESERTFIEELMVAWFAESEGKAKPQAASNPAGRILEALKVLGLVKHFGVKRSKTAGPEIVSIEVSTSSAREKVAISDVGFGVSQILPLIVKESLNEGAELLVYQPEVHLHPTAQSKLADFFVGAWMRGNRSIVETHSTYLIMRLQALVAMGKVPKGVVEVLCVEREDTESKIKKMEFDELGRPIEKWPRGFIDTSAVLAEELNDIRLAKRGK